MLLQLNVWGVGSAMGYLAYKSKLSVSSLAELAKEPAGVRFATGAIGVGSCLLGVRFLESLVYSSGDVTNGTGPLTRTVAMMERMLVQKGQKQSINEWIDKYDAITTPEDVNIRNTSYALMVDSFYKLVTHFYEWGWGASFHFAYRMQGETFSEGIRRHEYYLASQIPLKPGSKVVDVGCGIGGPMRNITRFTNWDVTGVTLNHYQVERCNEMCREEGLQTQCRAVQMDFHKLKLADGSLDGAFAVEATCHSPDRKDVFREVYRCLKPGAYFAFYEWCLTDKFNHSDTEHMFIKKMIEEGNGLPEMAHTSVIDQAVKDSGFELITKRDLAHDANQMVPWYRPVEPSWNPFIQRFQFNPVGTFVTIFCLRFLEWMWVAPPGTCKIQIMLNKALVGCSQGGEKDIFTPMYLCVCRKPDGAR